MPDTPRPHAKTLPSASWWRTVFSRRRQLAKSWRHRLALLVVLFVIGREMLATVRFGLDPVGITSALSIAMWCTALSMSATLLAGEEDASILPLLRLRGQPRELRARALFPARLALGLGMHGAGTLGLVLSVASVTPLSGALPALVGLLLLSLAFSCLLGAFASVCSMLAPGRPALPYWLVLIVPVVLHPALTELPSLFDTTAELTSQALSTLDS